MTQCTTCGEISRCTELAKLHIRVKHPKSASRNKILQHSRRLSGNVLSKLFPTPNRQTARTPGSTVSASDACPSETHRSTKRTNPHPQPGIYLVCAPGHSSPHLHGFHILFIGNRKHLLRLLAQIACERYDALRSSRRSSVVDDCAER